MTPKRPLDLFLWILAVLLSLLTLVLVFLSPRSFLDVNSVYQGF
jgi:hypothetical protein